MNTRGFSVIEVLIVIVVASVVSLALSEIFLTYYDSYAYQNANINAASSAALFLNELNDLSLQADAIVGSRAFSGTTYTSGSTTVVFELPSINSSGDVIASTYDYTVLYASSTNIFRIMDADASSARADGTKKLSDALGNLTFTYNNATPSLASQVSANVTTLAISKKHTANTRLVQTVYLRNK
jgi:prepilin-type N-terminal cleavage/methylation domain-containing protein